MKCTPFYKKTKFIVSMSVFALFCVLMIFGLKHNAQFNPSALFGKPVPTFKAFMFPAGQFDSSSVFYDKTTWKIVNFWSSTCYVCRDEALVMQNLFDHSKQKTGDQNAVYFVSVNIQDNQNTIARWQNDTGQNFPVIMDTTGSLSLDFGVTGTPETFLIDEQGKVRFRIAGRVDESGLLKLVAWLKQNPNSSETEIFKVFAQ